VALGFVIGVARLSSNWLISRLAYVYIEAFRNVPLLLQLFFWYFAILRPLPGAREAIVILPNVFLSNRGVAMPSIGITPATAIFVVVVLMTIVGIDVMRRWSRNRFMETGHKLPDGWLSLISIILVPAAAIFLFGSPIALTPPTMGPFNYVGGWHLLPEFVALTFGLVIYTASFIAEIVRSGIQSVSKGQTEAAYAIGLTPTQTLRLVVVPQALRVIVPPLTSQILNLTKNSSLAVAQCSIKRGRRLKS
jgi:general L-amino acid transport system permease protein